MTSRSQSRVPLAVLAGLLTLLLLPGAAPPTPAGGGPSFHAESLAATANAQLVGLATQVAKRVQTFHQNGSGNYVGSSTIATWPTNFTTTGNYSAISGFTETYSATATGGFYPQVNLTQGTVVVANTTDTIPFTVAPTFSATAVTDHVVELFSAVGAVPSNGAYTVTTVGQQQIAYSYSTPLNWSANASSSYAATYPLAAARGYWLNQSQVYLPFPSVPTGVNYSTVTILLNGTPYANFQVVQGGVYVNVASVGRGFTATLFARFAVLPAISGAAPVLVVSTYTALNLTTNQINASWTNEMNVPYAGEIIVQTHFKFEIDPASVTVQVGLRALPPGAFVVEGNTISILPLQVTIGSGSVAAFYVDFRFSNAPPSTQLTAASIAFSSGGTSVTWGQLTLGLAAAFAVLAVIAWFVAPRLRGAPSTGNSPLRAAGTFAVFAGVFLATWVVLEIWAGTGVPWL